MLAKLEKALNLAKEGFRIIPLKPNEKTPLFKEWQNKATKNIYAVKEWWTSYPDANIGIMTGNNLVVIDIDNKGGKNGTESLQNWVLANGELPPTRTVKTPNGGYHLYYKTDRELHNKVDVIFKGCGIDIRGTGGYVVAPGSIYGGKEYTFDDSQPLGITAANESVYALCEGHTIAERFILPETINQGSRDETIFKYACSLQAKGYSDNDIYAMAHRINAEKCKPPLSEKEVDIKVQSALRYPKGKMLPAKAEKQITVRSFAEIEDKEIKWLWYPYIPLGALTILSGAPGTGKTFFMCWLIATVSIGGFDLNPFDKHNVFIFNAEDDFGATLKKRLKGADANLENILAPEDRENPLFIPYTFDDDRLEALFKQYNPTLAVFDPMQAYIGGNVDLNRANQTRVVLTKLQALAERHETAVIIVAHLNKMVNQAVFDRVIGSVDIIGAARSALFLGKHPQNEGLKILFHMKHNLTPKGESRAYFIDNGLWREDHITDVSELTPDECAGQGKVKRDSKKAQAEKLLTEAFQEKKIIPAAELKKLAEDNGIGWETFRKCIPPDVHFVNKGFEHRESYYELLTIF